MEWQKRRPGGKDSGKVSSDVRDGVKLGADGEGEARGEEQSEVPGMYGMYEGNGMYECGNIPQRACMACMKGPGHLTAPLVWHV